LAQSGSGFAFSGEESPDSRTKGCPVKAGDLAPSWWTRAS